VHQEGQKEGWKGDGKIVLPLSQISNIIISQAECTCMFAE